MTTTLMDPVVATAMRAALVDHVAAAPAARRRRRWRGAAGAGIGLALVGGGVAVAQGVLTLPGLDRVADLGATVTVTRTGTATVDLGDPPDGATSVELMLTCLTAGTFRFNDGASMVCSDRDTSAGAGVATYTMPLDPGRHTTTITTDTPDARWTLTAGYSQHVPTDWGTNANGDTYGVENDRGAPDLIAVTATNGEEGYAYRAELEGPMPTSPAQAVQWQAEDVGKSHTIGVYASDGTTRIGDFVVPGLARTGEPAPPPAMPSRTP
ncbi:MAG: hypothetical protein KQH57_01510 [Actinomycetales bacterium]|nr:hypothetical protein [Actinomycetales bacterium]